MQKGCRGTGSKTRRVAGRVRRREAQASTTAPTPATQAQPAGGCGLFRTLPKSRACRNGPRRRGRRHGLAARPSGEAASRVDMLADQVLLREGTKLGHQAIEGLTSGGARPDQRGDRGDCTRFWFVWRGQTGAPESVPGSGGEAGQEWPAFEARKI